MASSLPDKNPAVHEKPQKHSYESISVGLVYSFEKIITREDVLSFAKLTGDFNQLHVDKEYGKTTQFGKNVAHGMLVASNFSTIIGMFCPGEKSLYLSQSINFKRPVFYDDKITVKATVTNKIDSLKVITLKMEILKDNIVCIDGEAKAKVL